MISREQMTSEIQDRLWRVLSAGTLSSETIRPDISSAIDPDSLRDISFGIFAISNQLAELLDFVSLQLRILPSQSSSVQVETFGYVRGPIDWDRTIQLRIDRSEPTLFIDADTTRTYDHLRSRAIRHLLDHVRIVLMACPELSPAHQATLLSRRRQVDVLSGHPKLRHVKQVRHLSPSRISSLEVRPGGPQLCYWIRFVNQIVEQSDLDIIAALLSENLLIPSKEDFLFELLVGFRMVSYLESIDFKVESMQVLPQSRKPFCTLSRNDERLILWYQRSINSLRTDRRDSRYSTIRELNGLRRSSLRPDFVLLTGEGEGVVVEVKHSAVLGGSHIRAGITDAMAYIADTPEFFSKDKGLKAIVVASDSSAIPSPNLDIAVASQDLLSSAMQFVIQ